MAARKAGTEVVRLNDPVNVLRRVRRKETNLQAKLRQAVDQVALEHNLTVEDVVRSTITPKTTPSLHRELEGNRVNTQIAKSVDGYEICRGNASILYIA